MLRVRAMQRQAAGDRKPLSVAQAGRRPDRPQPSWAQRRRGGLDCETPLLNGLPEWMDEQDGGRTYSGGAGRVKLKEADMPVGSADTWPSVILRNTMDRIRSWSHVNSSPAGPAGRAGRPATRPM